MTTTTRPQTGYRPMPRDFPDTFARVGWEGIEQECRAHKTTIKKWMVAYGEEQLIHSRRMYLEDQYTREGKRVGGIRPGRKLGISGRYVMGRTRRPKVIVWPCRAPAFWDFALLPAPPVVREASPRPSRMTGEQAARIVEVAAVAMSASGEFMAGLAKAAELLRAQGVEA